jgi:hypothetical protein
MDVTSLTPVDFEWAVSHMASMAIRLATAPRSRPEARWEALLRGHTAAGETAAVAPAPQA